MKTQTLSVDSNRVNSILKHYGVVEAFVFGSYARGADVRPESDVDLLVTYKAGTTLFDIADLQRELEHEFNRKVDLISKKHLSNRLAKRIENDIRPLSSVL